MSLSPANVHVNAALTNLAIGYNPMTAGFIAEQAVSVIPVQKEADTYYIWNRGDAFRIPSTLRADGAESNQVEFGLSTSTYSALEYALSIKLTDRQKANADSVLRLQQSSQTRLQNLLLADMEKRVATLLTTQGNYASTNRVQKSGTTQWSSGSYSEVIETVIDTGKEAVRAAIGLDPNIIIIPSAVAKVMKRNATIRELIKYTHADLLVDGDLPPMLWGMKVLIPKGINATSVEGATVTMADLWGKHVVMTYKPTDGSIDTPAHSYIFRKGNWQTKTWREEKKASDFIETSVIQDEVITSNISGYLIEDVIS
jgi:methylmalonyl-CoA mutase cobalamin-binding subunit